MSSSNSSSSKLSVASPVMPKSALKKDTPFKKDASSTKLKLARVTTSASHASINSAHSNSAHSNSSPPHSPNSHHKDKDKELIALKTKLQNTQKESRRLEKLFSDLQTENMDMQKKLESQLYDKRGKPTPSSVSTGRDRTRSSVTPRRPRSKSDRFNVDASEDVIMKNIDPAQTESQLVEALVLVQTLQANLQKAEKEKDEMKHENETLRVELQMLSNQLKESLASSHAQITSQISQLQQAVLDYQQKYQDMMQRKQLEKQATIATEEMKQRVSELQTTLISLQRDHDQLKQEKQPNLSQYHNRIKELEQSIQSHQQKYEMYRSKIQKFEEKQKFGSDKALTQKLGEKVSNLTFHLFYAAGLKEAEQQKKPSSSTSTSTLSLSQPQSQSPSSAVSQNMIVDKLLVDRALEDWLFTGLDDSELI